MNLGELIAYAKNSADDNASGELWSEEEWINFANDAQNEACRRARLLVDSTSPLTELSLPAGEPTVALDPRILVIRRARLVGRSPLLQRVSHHTLDCAGSGWEDETGEPRGYVPDMDTQVFRPYPMPEADATVRLTVVRLPLKEMAEEADKLEVPPHLHRSLAAWMLYRAFSKQDGEAFDKKKAAEYLAEFEQEFGRKSTAIDEAWLQREHEYIVDEGNF
jgi:hypothetical protein